MTKQKVLIVDDEPLTSKLISTHLRDMDYDVDESNHPLDALEKINKENYRVVILDIVLPEMTGLELLQKIKKKDVLTHAIVITAYNTMGNIMEAFKLGASNVFFKPFKNLNEISAEVSFGFNKLGRIYEVLREQIKNK